MTTLFDAARDPARSPNAALIGIPGGALQLTTPALTIDLPTLRWNLAGMASRCRSAGLALRPQGSGKVVT